MEAPLQQCKGFLISTVRDICGSNQPQPFVLVHSMGSRRKHEHTWYEGRYKPREKPREKAVCRLILHDKKG
jgi:hypothetical protein